jgi:hypothetical protein
MSTLTADPGLVRIGAKLYADDASVIDLPAYVPIFHGWIQRRILDGTPIDVADYAHVPDGPGVMLIGHEADRSIDMGEGRPGVLYQRKRIAEGSLEDRFAAAIAAADGLADELEADSAADGVSFGRDEILLKVTDRRRAANDDEALDALRPAIADALGRVRPGRQASIERLTGDPKGPLTIRVRLS